MKTLTAILFAVLIASCSAPKTIQCSYNYKESETRYYPSKKGDSIEMKIPVLRNKDKLVVEIDSINRLLFDVNVSGTDQSITQDDTNILDSLLEIANTTPNPRGNLSDTGRGEENNPENNSRYSLKFRGWDFSGNENIINSIKLRINKCLENLDTQQMKMKSIFEYAKTVPVIIAGERYSQANIIRNLVDDFNKRRIVSDSATNLISIICTINTLPGESMDSIYNYIALIKQNKQELIDNLTKFREKQPTDYLNALTKTIADASKITRDSVLTAMKVLTGILNQSNDPKNFYYTETFYPKDDFFQVGIKIKPRDICNNCNTDTISFKFPVNGKFEWAIGPALNFGFTNGNFDNTYRIDTARNSTGVIKQDTFNVRKNDNNNSALPSIGLMAHFYWQQHWPVTPGISVGISTSPNDLSQLKAYLGACILVGGFSTDNSKNPVYNKLIFSVGFSYGKVDRLNSSLHEGDNPKSQIPYNGNTIAKDQLTEKVGKIGGYFGISYNIH